MKKNTIVGFLVLLPLVGFATADTSVISRRAQELDALLTPGMRLELEASAKNLPRAEPPAPPEDLTRDLENRVWREENLAERYDQKLFSDPPRVPSPITVPGSLVASQLRLNFQSIAMDCRTLDLLREQEARWTRAGNVSRAEETHQRHEKAYQNLQENVKNLIARGDNFVQRSDRAEFKRLSKELTDACAAYHEERGKSAVDAKRS